jgi:hypothetical protein
MKRDCSVTSGSTIKGGGAILVSPSRVPETGAVQANASVANPFALPRLYPGSDLIRADAGARALPQGTEAATAHHLLVHRGTPPLADAVRAQREGGPHSPHGRLRVKHDAVRSEGYPGRLSFRISAAAIAPAANERNGRAASILSLSGLAATSPVAHCVGT